MPRDTKRAKGIHSIIKDLQKRGVSARVWEVPPHPLTIQVCQDRIPEFCLERCQALLQLQHNQRHHKGLFGEDFTVLEPYKKGGKWDSVFRKAHLDPPDFDRIKSKSNNIAKGTPNHIQFSGHSWLWAAVVEEIAVGYGYHEMTAQFRDQILEFLLQW